MAKTDFYLLIFKDLIRKKFSTFLTVFAISLGILSIFVILIITQSFNDSIEGQLEEFGSNLIMIQAQTGSNLKFTDSQVRSLERFSNINSVYGSTQQRIQFQDGREFRRVSVFATELSETFFNDFNMIIEEGTAPNPRSKYDIVIGPDIAEDRFSTQLRVGSRLTFNEISFRVVGITQKVGNPEDDSLIYMQYEALREFGIVNDFDMLIIFINDAGQLDRTQEQIIEYFRRDVGENRVTVLTSRDILEQLNTITGLITGVLGGIAFISLIVGALGIINTMFVIVTEKIKDIGIMKSVGARNFEILLLFIFQSSLFGILGAILGILIGILTLFGIEIVLINSGFTFLEIQIYPLVVGQMLLFGAIVGAVAGFIPSYIASKMDVVEALRK
ncbi:MAG: ABC transporter permease [Nanoarchaeota archaeon]|nr:ABC transporter permease [Nanoarchaeota archaeon]